MEQNRKISLSFLLLMAVFLIVGSCKQPEVVHVPSEIEEISLVADTNGIEALRMVEQMERKYLDAEESVRMRLTLLHVKAKDKADIPITDDTLMMRVVDYYEKSGTANQKLEAYYYLAGTYRDLHDSPRALTTYLRAAEIGEHYVSDVDSTLLFHVYSQLSDVYDKQDNDQDALISYRKGLAAKGGMEKANAWDFVVLAQSYEHLGLLDSCLIFYKKAMNLMVEEKDNKQRLGNVGSMLATFIRYGCDDYAQLCFNWLKGIKMEELPPNACCMKGLYFKKIGLTDSAETYFSHAFDRFSRSNAKRDCALKLYLMFDSIHDYSKALLWAGRYIENSRLANEEMAHEHVLQINNEYKYRRDIENENRLKKEAVVAEKRFWMAVALLLLAVLAGGAGIYTYRYLLQKEYSAHSLLKGKVERERLKRNKVALDLSEVAAMFKNSHTPLESESWEILFASVDKTYPDFRNKVETAFPKLKTNQLQLLYLFKAGLKRIEIARAMKIDRSLISRRIHQLEDWLGAKLETL